MTAPCVGCGTDWPRAGLTLVARLAITRLGWVTRVGAIVTGGLYCPSCLSQYHERQMAEKQRA